MSRILQILIVLAVLNVMGAGLLWFEYTSMQDKKVQEADLRNQLAEEIQKNQKLATLKKTLESAEAERVLLEKFLFDPSEESQIALISQMELLGSVTTGALVTTMSLDLTSGDPRSLNGNFTVSGTWGELYHLLQLVESFPTHVVINRFELRLSPEAANPNPLLPKSSLDKWAGSLSASFVSLKSSQ